MTWQHLTLKAFYIYFSKDHLLPFRSRRSLSFFSFGRVKLLLLWCASKCLIIKICYNHLMRSLGLTGYSIRAFNTFIEFVSIIDWISLTFRNNEIVKIKSLSGIHFVNIVPHFCGHILYFVLGFCALSYWSFFSVVAVELTKYCRSMSFFSTVTVISE